MDRRPWPIVLLAIIHFLEPVAKIGFYSLLWEMPVSVIIKYLGYQASFLEMFLFCASFPLAGIAILAVKNWSLPAFIVIQAITLIGHIYFHIEAPKAFPIYLIASLSVLNATVVIYFLVPSVRAVYTDPKLRWWEAKPRYIVDWAGRALQGRKDIPVKVCNLSEGGVLVEANGKSAALEPDEPVQVEFSFQNSTYSFPGIVRHFSRAGAPLKFGIQFSEVSPGARTKLKRAIRALKRAGYRPMGRSQPAWTSFVSWSRKLVKTGSGLFPEVKKPVGQTNQISVSAAKTSKRKAA
jgi:hypothetical protein